MEPVLPGRYAVLTVGGIRRGTRLYAFTLADAVSRFPEDGPIAVEGGPRPLPIVQRTGECVTVDVPPGPFAALAIGISPRFDPANAWTANRPRIDWAFPTHGEPGGRVVLIGRNLVAADQYRHSPPDEPVSYGDLRTGQTRVVARRVGRRTFHEVAVTQSSGYEARVELPASLRPGRYEFFAHNGRGGAGGWSNPLTLTVGKPQPEPTRVIRVDDYVRPGESVRITNYWAAVGANEPPSRGGTADRAIARALAALRRGGGGILQFSAGIYDLGRTIVLPPGTVLRGMGATRTWLRGPGSRGPVGPYVLITGERDFAVEDLRVTATYAPLVVCAPTFLPPTFEEAIACPFSWSRPRARNVAIRRCHIEQKFAAHLDRRKDDPAFVERIDKLALAQDSRFRALCLRGDDLIVEDNTIYGGGTCIQLNGAQSVRISRNTLRIGPGGGGVTALASLQWPRSHPKRSRGAIVRGNYCRNILVEENDIRGYSERARSGVYFLYGGEHFHAARNRIGDLAEIWDCEALGCHLWSARWTEPTIRMLGPTTAIIVDPRGEVAHECLDDAMIEVIDGRGTGQIRRILRRRGDRVELDRPWIVAPDRTSRVVFTAPPPFLKVSFVDNQIASAGTLVLFWGCGHDVVIDGNRCAHGPGIQVCSIRLAAAQKVWGGVAFCTLTHNTLAHGWADPAGDDILFNACESCVTGLQQVGVINNPCIRVADCTAAGYDHLGWIVRENLTTDNSGIVFKTRFQPLRKQESGELLKRFWTLRHAGVVIENNHARDSAIGVLIEKGARVKVRGNTARNVASPVVWTRSKAWGR